MKKISAAFFLIFILAFATATTVRAQDAPAADQPAAAAPAEATAAVPAAPAEKPAEEKKPDEEKVGIKDAAVTGSIIHTLLSYLGGIIGLLLTGLIIQALRKMGINISADTEKFLRKQADSVISQVDAWAVKLAKQGKKPKSHVKLARGLEFLDRIVQASGVAGQPLIKLTNIIEERLIRRKEKGEHVAIATEEGSVSSDPS